VTSAAEAVDENKPVIAAVNHCATQKQMQRRVFPQAVKSCPSQNALDPEFFRELFSRTVGAAKSIAALQAAEKLRSRVRASL
jgi:hypothetical protein